MNRNRSVCNIKIDEKNYFKDRTVCKSCYKKNRRKNNNNTLIQNQQLKSDNNNDDDKKKRKVGNSMNNRTLIIGFSNEGKLYLMNDILHQKEEPIFIFAKSLIQYPKIKAQTSEEIEPLVNYENNTVVFDDMLLSKQESYCSLFFTPGRHNIFDIY